MRLKFLGKKRRKHESAEINTIERILVENKIEFNISEVYRLGETVYQDNALLNRVREEIAASNLEYLLNLSGVDITKDLIQIYLVVDDKKKNLLLGIIDPYEPYDNPTVIGFSRDVDCDLALLSERKIK